MRQTTVYLLRFCLLLFPVIVGSKSAEAQQQKAKRISLKQAIEAVEKKFGTKFAYEHNLLEGKFTTEEALKGETVPEILKSLLYPNNLIFLYVSNNAYSIVARSASFFQGNTPAPSREIEVVVNMGQAPVKQTVRGLVTDLRGTPLPFVNIWVKGSNNGSQTSDRGEFLVSNVSSNDTLVFTYVGFLTETVGVNGRNSITVQMLPDSKNTLDEVVVVSTGLQQLPKERATGSFSTISAKEIEKVPVPNVIQRIEGMIPGVKISVRGGDRSFVYAGSGNLRSASSATRTTGRNDYDMAIRGTSTFNAETFPLVVLDGAITEMDISTLNPDDIESISFLKDAAAASIWGVRAANGVMVITTKKGRANQVPSISFSANASIAGKPDVGYLHMMNSAEMIDYETELVRRGYLNATNINASSYNTAVYYPAPASALALKRQAGLISQAAYDASIDSLSRINNYDQINKYILQPANSQQYNLSVSGGNNYSSYFYSASYSKERPNTRRSDGSRLTLTFNNNWKLFKIATLTTSFKGSFFKLNNNGLALTSLFNANNSPLLPYQLITDENGKGINYDRTNPDWTRTVSGYRSWTYNYMDELNYGDNTSNDNNYVANIDLKVPVYKGLEASVMYTNERSFGGAKNYYDPRTYYFRNTVNSAYYPSAPTEQQLILPDGTGILSQSDVKVNNYALRGQLSYNKVINRIHQLNVIAGSEIRQTQITGATNTIYGYNPQTGISTPVNFGSYAYYSPAGYSTSIGGAPTYTDKRRRYLSYFSNAAYTLLNKYSLSASVRYDDYNNFGLDRKYRATPAWSTGAKWMISKEEFMKPLTWISNLGLRLTYGVNGNIAPDQFPYTYVAVGGSPDPVTGLPYSSVINLANPQLSWEKTYVTNIALDFGFLDNRISGAIDFYNKDGRNLVYGFPINPAYAGLVNGSVYSGTTLVRNTATLSGKGVDMSLNGVMFSKKDWSWSAGLTFSYNTNKVTDSRFDTSALSAYTKSYNVYSIGQLAGFATDKLMVFRNAGLNAAGNTRTYNANGDTVGSSTYLAFADLKNAGRTSAPFFGGFNTSFKYKSFTIYAMLTYQFGNVFLKPTVSSYLTQYYRMTYDLSGAVADRWKQPGDELRTNVPGLAGNATTVNNNLMRFAYSDANVLPADYIRLREISLSYQLPSSLLPRDVIKGASLTATVRNLGLLWTANKEGYDPDFIGYPGGSYSLPAAKSYNLSLSINF